MGRTRIDDVRLTVFDVRPLEVGIGHFPMSLGQGFYDVILSGSAAPRSEATA